MKELKDYLHLYLGCEIIGTYSDGSGSKGYLTGVTNGGHECETQFILEDSFNVSEEPEFYCIEEVKPILRQLNSMTEEEMDEILRIGEHQHNGTGLKGFIAGWKAFGAETFKYLLSKHFDLFGLIESGLAIDATKINSTTIKQ